MPGATLTLWLELGAWRNKGSEARICPHKSPVLGFSQGSFGHRRSGTGAEVRPEASGEREGPVSGFQSNWQRAEHPTLRQQRLEQIRSNQQFHSATLG